MRRLGPTVAQLSKMRSAIAAMASQNSSDSASSRLDRLDDFGSNPGSLVAKIHVPASLAAGAGLVVVLHGCTQNATSYDRGSGWSDLADRHGFAVLFPEQIRANNPNLCFNWYQASDSRRGRGEAASIAQMVEHMIGAHQLDPARVFVTGLSAGGAMTAVMIATYPELFAGAAVIAGLPYGLAEGVPQALEMMRGQSFPSRAAIAGKAQKAADHAGPWPTLSVWHGTADAIVSPANAEIIIEQWRDRIDLDDRDVRTDTVDGHRRTTWHDEEGRAMIQRFDIGGMGHGTPLSTRGAKQCGTAGPHMIEAGICSTSHIARSWGLVPIAANANQPTRSTAPITAKRAAITAKPTPATAPLPATGVHGVIENALRAAGLMR